MNKRIKVSVALSITILAMTVTFSITWLLSMHTFDNTVSAVTRLQAQYQKLAEIDNYVRGNYYKDIDDNALFDRVATGYINGLGDRYSAYYTEKEYTELMAVESGERVGVGLEVTREAEGSYRIARVYADSPAAKAGVENYGRITKVNGVETKNFLTTAQIKSAMMGEPGTELILDCTYNISDNVSFTIRRSNYKAPTVESFLLGNYAYLRISSFDASTESDFDFCLRQALNAEVKGIVFDVRGTATGMFRNSYPVIDMLAPRGTVASRMDKTGTMRVLDTSDENAVDLPMAVLVNENTSGPAELFAVSVRDMCGGKVVGTTTAGHGTIQSTPQRLSDGSAVSVTIAQLYTGNNETFDLVGVVPDDEIRNEDITDAMLLNPQPNNDMEVLRAFEVVRALVRDRGGDPGDSITTQTPITGGTGSIQTPAPASSSSSPPADDSTDSSVAESLPDDSAPATESTAASSSSEAVASSSSEAAASSSSEAASE